MTELPHRTRPFSRDQRLPELTEALVELGPQQAGEHAICSPLPPAGYPDRGGSHTDSGIQDGMATVPGSASSRSSIRTS